MEKTTKRALKFSTITIGTGGAMPESPGVISVRTGQWVVWAVQNASSKKLTLTLKDFVQKSSGKPVKAIKWLKANRSTIPAGAVGLIAGQVVYRPRQARERIKYTVGVAGPAKLDYDPDLEVSPPN